MKYLRLLTLITLFVNLSWSQSKKIEFNTEGKYRPFNLVNTQNGNIVFSMNNFPTNTTIRNKKKHFVKSFLIDPNEYKILSEYKGTYKFYRSFNSYDGSETIFHDNGKDNIHLANSPEKIPEINTGQFFNILNSPVYRIMLKNGFGGIKLGPQVFNKINYNFWKWDGQKTQINLDKPAKFALLPRLISFDKSTFTLSGKIFDKDANELNQKTLGFYTYNDAGQLNDKFEILFKSQSDFSFPLAKQNPIENIFKGKNKNEYYYYGIQKSNSSKKSIVFIYKFDKQGIIWKEFYELGNEKDKYNTNSVWTKIKAGLLGDKIIISVYNTKDEYLKVFLGDDKDGKLIKHNTDYFKSESGYKAFSIGNSVLDGGITLKKKGQKKGLDILTTSLTLLDNTTFSLDFLDTKKFKVSSLLSKGKLILVKHDLKEGNCEMYFYDTIK